MSNVLCPAMNFCIGQQTQVITGSSLLHKELSLLHSKKAQVKKKSIGNSFNDLSIQESDYAQMHWHE